MESEWLAEARDHDELFVDDFYEAATDNEESDVSELSSEYGRDTDGDAGIDAPLVAPVDNAPLAAPVEPPEVLFPFRSHLRRCADLPRHFGPPHPPGWGTAKQMPQGWESNPRPRPRIRCSATGLHGPRRCLRSRQEASVCSIQISGRTEWSG